MQVPWQVLMPAYGHLRAAVDTRTGTPLGGTGGSAMVL